MCQDQGSDIPSPVPKFFWLEASHTFHQHSEEEITQRHDLLGVTLLCVHNTACGVNRWPTDAQKETSLQAQLIFFFKAIWGYREGARRGKEDGELANPY